MTKIRSFIAVTITALLAAMASFGAQAQPVALFGGTPITASSGNVANANAVATLAAVAGKTTHICGFALTSAGATVGLPVAPTVTGVVTGTQTYTYAAVAGVLLVNQPLVMSFTPCLAASATNTTIVVTLPALGAGNTNASATAWGYQY
jgi:hypothetical protein